jgi:hypothetical protein
MTLSSVTVPTLVIIPYSNREGDLYSLVSEKGLSSSNGNPVIEPE